MVFAGCCILAAMGFGMPMTVFSVFVTPLVAYLDTKVTVVMLYYTLATAFQVIPLLLVPRLMKRIDLVCIIAVAGVVLGLAFVLLALIPCVGMVWLAGALVGLSCATSSILVIPVIISNWFIKKQGTFMGVSLAFSGVGSAVMSPIISAAIQNHGWQTAMIALGVLVAVLIVVSALFLVRTAPASVGLQPFGANDALESDDVSGDGEKACGVLYKDIFRMPAFWILACMFVLVGFVSILTTQANTIVQSSGFSAAVAGVVVSCTSIGAICGKLILGWVADKKNAAVMGLVDAVFLWIALACYVAGILSGTVALMYCAGFFGGMAAASATMAGPMFTKDAFGTREYGSIYGTIMLFGTAGSALAAPVFSLFYDLGGSYIGALVMLAVLAVVFVPLGFAGVRSGRKSWS